MHMTREKFDYLRNLAETLYDSGFRSYDMETLFFPFVNIKLNVLDAKVLKENIEIMETLRFVSS